MDIKDLTSYLEKITTTVTATVKNEGALNDLGQEMVNTIRERTRSGRGVDSSGTTYGLKPLASGYVKQRQYMAKKGRLSSYTSPSTSNLTQTGRMLDNITWVAAEGKLTIKFTNPTDAQKAAYVSEERPFLNITNPELMIIIDKVTEKVRKSIESAT